MKFFAYIRFKEILKIFLFILILFILLFYAKSNFTSVHTSVELFLSNILPSLFPFIFFTEFILNTNIIELISKYFGKFINLVFKLNKESTPAFLIGFLCGYPMGAKTVATLYETGKITRKEAEKLLTFVNNCNPVFIISTIGYSIFNNIHIGYVLLISHILSALIIAIFNTRVNIPLIIHKNYNNLNSFNEKYTVNKEKKDNITLFNTIKKCLFNSLKTLSLIFGFIVIFNLIFSIFKTIFISLNVNTNIIAFLSGIFEVTQGAKNVANLIIPEDFKICLISFLLGFSGLCIIFQIYSTISEHKFSFKSLVFSKLLQGIISSIITYIMLQFYTIPNTTNEIFFNIDNNITEEVFLQNVKVAYVNSVFVIIFALAIYMVLCIYKKRE